MKNFFLILSFFLPVLLFAQGSKEYSFKHFSTANGLASNTINAFVQDKEGYIWMGTDNGLQRYDGSSFKTFSANKNDPASLPADRISNLYRDRKNNIWLIADYKKAGRFDTKKFVFKEVPVHAKKPNQNFRFLEYPTGELLLYQEFGAVLRYDENKDQFIQDDEIIPLPKNWIRNAITWDPFFKKYWMSCDSGLVQYDPFTKHLNYRNHNPDRDPVIEHCKNQLDIFDVSVDGAKNVIFLRWPRQVGAATVLRFMRHKNSLDSTGFWPQLGYHEVRGSFLESNGRFWIYGYSFLAEWKPTEKTLDVVPNEYRNEHSIKFDYANNMYEDKERNLWFATDNGVYLFNPDGQVFNSYKLIRPGEKTAEGDVQAEAEANGKIFIGCWGIGVYCYDKNLNALPLPKGMEQARRFSVWDMEVNSKTGELWMALQNGEIAVYNFKKQKLTRVAPPVFEHSTVRQLDEDTSGNFWFGTQNGKVIRWSLQNSGNDPGKGYEWVYQTSRVLKVHFDYSGYFWVATMGDGLLKFDKRTGKLLKTFKTDSPEGERLFTNSPNDITYYNDSTLLVSGGCINVINTKTNKVSFITKEDGLPENATMSLQRDRSGIVWVGMSNGICRVNVEKKIVSYYDRREGIVVDKFNPSGVVQLNDGQMLFFTDHNFLVFDPNKFVYKAPPKPFITSFQLAGNSLLLDSLQKTGKVTLKYNNTALGVEFSALSFLPQLKLHYFYKLEGVDKDWIHTDRPIEAVYNFLPPGDYVFQVKSENADGATSEVTEIPVIVRPPVYKTWWFFCLVILDIIMVLYLIDRERMKKIRSMQQLRMQIAGNLHSEINTALDNINVLSEIAKIKADRNVEQSKEFIDQISDKSRFMIESMDDMLWSIHPENDSMKKTLARIKELTEGLNADYEVDIDLIIDHKLQTLELSMKLRHELYFFYKEAMLFLLHNSSCNQKFVNINLVRSKLKMEILSECGKDDQHLAGQFRKAVQKRVENMNGTLDVLSDNSGFSAVLSVLVR